MSDWLQIFARTFVQNFVEKYQAWEKLFSPMQLAATIFLGRLSALLAMCSNSSLMCWEKAGCSIKKLVTCKVLDWIQIFMKNAKGLEEHSGKFLLQNLF